jgi:hypothetical protein
MKLNGNGGSYTSIKGVLSKTRNPTNKLRRSRSGGGGGDDNDSSGNGGRGDDDDEVDRYYEECKQELARDENAILLEGKWFLKVDPENPKWTLVVGRVHNDDVLEHRKGELWIGHALVVPEKILAKPTAAVKKITLSPTMRSALKKGSYELEYSDD